MVVAAFRKPTDTMNPNFFTYIMMYGILAYSVHIFGKYPIRTSVIIVTVTGWMFLPQAHLEIPHIPFKTKTQAISVALLLGVLVKDPGFLKKIRWSWIDIPMACWCLAPFMASMTNAELGFYDGLNVLEFQLVDFAIPYVMGRAYFSTYEGLKDLAIGQVLGAVALLPLVIVELVMSPQVHTWVYGWYPHDFSQTVRDGGYRPSVFMSHGLELAIWNAAAAFIGWQLFMNKGLPKVLPILKTPTLPSLILLTVVFARCHSTGALGLFLLAMVMFVAAVKFKSKLPFLFLIMIPFLYMDLRGSGAWDGQNFLNFSKAVTGSADRVASLEYRFMNENLLVEKARQKLLFGWGAYGRSFITDAAGHLTSVPDGRWIVIIGSSGLFGLTSFTAFMLLPAFLFILRCPIREFSNPLVVSAACFATFLIITMIDNLFNAMDNPVLIVAAGGLSSLVISRKSLSPERVQGIASSSAPIPQYSTRMI